MAMLTTAAGVDLLHVPFQGGGPALTALLAGQVQALVSAPALIAPHIRDGRLRALANWGARRLWPARRGADPDRARLPGGRNSTSGPGLRARWCPAPVLAALRQGLGAAARDAEVQRALAASGNTLDYREGEAFDAFFRSDAARLQRAVRRIGKIE